MNIKALSENARTSRRASRVVGLLAAAALAVGTLTVSATVPAEALTWKVSQYWEANGHPQSWLYGYTSATVESSCGMYMLVGVQCSWSQPSVHVQKVSGSVAIDEASIDFSVNIFGMSYSVSAGTGFSISGSFTQKTCQNPVYNSAVGHSTVGVNLSGTICRMTSLTGNVLAIGGKVTGLLKDHPSQVWHGHVLNLTA